MGEVSRRWLPLEANPDVMSTYISTLGGQSEIKFTDVIACEDWAYESVPKPVRALMVVFPITKEMEDDALRQAQKVKREGQELSKRVWFTKQTIGNACGTIGLLHAVYNLNKPAFRSGSFLDNFSRKVKDMTPEQRAKALEESEDIMQAHASVEREGQSHVPCGDDEIDTHFVTLVAVDGCLYELDGRKEFPINHGPCPSDKFLENAVEVVKRDFMGKTAEIRFSMIAVSEGA